MSACFIHSTGSVGLQLWPLISQDWPVSSQTGISLKVSAACDTENQLSPACSPVTLSVKKWIKLKSQKEFQFQALCQQYKDTLTLFACANLSDMWCLNCQSPRSLDNSIVLKLAGLTKKYFVTVFGLQWSCHAVLPYPQPFQFCFFSYHVNWSSWTVTCHLYAQQSTQFVTITVPSLVISTAFLVLYTYFKMYKHTVLYWL